MGPKWKNISAMLIFGSIGLFVRGIPLDSPHVVLGRCFIGAGFLLLTALAMKSKPDLEAMKRNGWLLVFSGAALGFNWVCLFESYRYTTIAVSTLSYYLAPVFVMLLSPLVLKEKLSGVRAACAAVSLAGMALVSGVLGGAPAGKNNTLGVLLGILAAAQYAAIVLMNKFFRELSARDCSMAQLTVAGVCVLPYALARGGSWSMSAGGWGLLLVLGVVHTGAAYMMYFASLRELPAQTAAMLSYIDPLTAVLLSVALLREPMSGAQWVGAVLVLGALLAAEVLEGRKRGGTPAEKL